MHAVQKNFLLYCFVLYLRDVMPLFTLKYLGLSKAYFT
ncbi:hypothetical protein A1OE_570 [Candidatus Endolissoclinum faulkneri L2]|uniref:Uncharacterized protein n=1 Tax=Candidatus Endolissoclinum faulkneri L2 TaxID=1193729 RepID=K7ZCN8_9PROT|nr:hypothetical protein A1OE_570 [Candidatus Endolissoclinum faulkneri L2]